MEKAILIRPYKHHELADLYCVSWKTLKRWLEPYKGEIGPKIGHYYSVNQVRIIFKLLGPPPGFSLSNDNPEARTEYELV